LTSCSLDERLLSLNGGWLGCFDLNQINEEGEKFGKAAGIRSCCCYGGASKGPQIRDLNYGVDIVIATPGRLLDLISMTDRFTHAKVITLQVTPRLLPSVLRYTFGTSRECVALHI
jgi:hypothetical protein